VMQNAPIHAASGPANRRAYRLSEIDLLRGIAIVVMALDHVRDFFIFSAEQDPMANPNVALGLFATRWVTHFCAPVFVLLAGVSAGLMAARKSPGELTRFLFTRGLWLIFVEWFIISTAWTFAPGGIEHLGGLVLIPMQVIWVTGASMIVLSITHQFGRAFCFVTGAAIIALHNLLDIVWPASQLFEQDLPLWVALHGQMAYTAGPFLLIFIYPLLPWVGVMLAGFGIVSVFEMSPADRQATLLRSCLGLTTAFIVLRALDLYGDPNSWNAHQSGITATVIDFLNTTKYPPSLLYLLMTLGPASGLCALAGRTRGFLKETLVMFGRVPFAFYVTHFLLIHSLSVLLGVLQGFNAREFLTIFFYYPNGYGLPLSGVYAVWAIVIMTLYPFCRWVAGVKARRKDWWLSYL
jgi:uncharacterized membrane protein